MAPKMKAAITDRATAKKAKAYVYGVKEMRKLEAVKKTNLYIQRCDSQKDVQSLRNTSSITINRALTVVVRLTLFVLYLYMLWSFMNN
jgi:hypothetical protein